MEYKRGTEFSAAGRTAVTIGKFDGIHLGHQILMKKILEKKQEGLEAVVFTFHISPRAFLRGNQQNELTTSEERKFLLEQMGIDYLFECLFCEAIAKMEPEEFIKKILVDQLHVKYLAVGPDFRFGYQKKGNKELLEKYAHQYDYQLEVVEKITHEGQDISSTYIKEKLLTGQIAEVRKLLGYPYTICGPVVYGNKLGRKMGMPTANIFPGKTKMLPEKGVYVSETLIDGQSYAGITNIGKKPTIGEEYQVGAETYLLDFDGDLYGREIAVKLLEFRRKEKKFASIEELKIQIEDDIAFGKEYFHLLYKNV